MLPECAMPVCFARDPHYHGSVLVAGKGQPSQQQRLEAALTDAEDRAEQAAAALAAALMRQAALRAELAGVRRIEDAARAFLWAFDSATDEENEIGGGWSVATRFAIGHLRTALLADAAAAPTGAEAE